MCESGTDDTVVALWVGLLRVVSTRDATEQNHRSDFALSIGEVVGGGWSFPGASETPGAGLRRACWCSAGRITHLGDPATFGRLAAPEGE